MPLMEAFEQDSNEGQSRYVFVPKPGKHGKVLNAVSVKSDGTICFEIKGQNKAELAKKTALIEKALGSKTTTRDVAQPDGGFTRTLTLRTQAH